MTNVQLMAHIPRLRMEPAAVDLPVGTLVKPTWDSYDAITLGAFTDWAAAYEAADPVFLLLEGEIDLPFLAPGHEDVEGMSEMKFRSTAWNDLIPQILGSPFLTAFHDQVADVVWAALMLAAPGAAPGWPRTSVTFLLPDDGHVHLPDGGRHTGLRIQCEADQEYVYSADTACAPLTDAQLQRAATLVPVVQRLRDDERLGPALGQLLATTEATLAPAERLVIAVSALEGLLLPEVRSGLQDTFATRVAQLLGPWADAPARDLYRARSRAVHDGPDAAEARITPGVAEQVLADVLIASLDKLAAPADDLAGGDPEVGPVAAARAVEGEERDQTSAGPALDPAIPRPRHPARARARGRPRRAAAAPAGVVVGDHDGRRGPHPARGPRPELVAPGGPGLRGRDPSGPRRLRPGEPDGPGDRQHGGEGHPPRLHRPAGRRGRLGGWPGRDRAARRRAPRSTSR